MSQIQTDLNNTVFAEDFEGIDECLTAGADINEPIQGGFTALYICAYFGYNRTLSHLIERGAIVDLKVELNGLKYTALQGAIFAKKLDTARILIRAGADPYLKMAGKDTFGWAEKLEILDKFTNLIEEEKTIAKSHLFEAVQCEDKHTIEKCCKIINLDEIDPLFGTALYIACVNGSYSMVEFLLDKGVTVDLKFTLQRSAKKGEEYNTALLGAIKNKKLNIIKLLLTRGANPNLEINSDKTALTYAKQYSILEPVEQIINEVNLNNNLKLNNFENHKKKMKKFNFKNLTKEEILVKFNESVCNNEVDVLETCLEYGVDINRVDCEGCVSIMSYANGAIIDKLLCSKDIEYTALQGAVQAKSSKCCELLLQAGANPYFKPKSSNAFDYAKRVGWSSEFAELVKKHCKIVPEPPSTTLKTKNTQKNKANTSFSKKQKKILKNKRKQ
ncbi:hypothetical protein ABK040_015826 [Willaertia magna]